ncbi:hypothetical protein Tco_0901456 [Tanacetum coccineum]
MGSLREYVIGRAGLRFALDATAREKADVVGSLYDVSEQGFEDEEEDDDSFIDTTDVENKPIQSGKKFHK